VHYLDYNEQIQHCTGDFPMAYYFVDERHPRYHMPMHWHREMEILRIRSGSLRLYIDDREICAEAGDVLIIGEGVIHGGDPEACVYECLVFDPKPVLMYVEACKRAVSPLLNRNIFIRRQTLGNDEVFRAAVDRLCRYGEKGIVGFEMKVMGALFEFTAALLDRMDEVQADVFRTRSGQKAEQLKPALEYIETHYSQNITLDELARLTGLSSKYFCRYFKAIVHRSPIDYLNYYRIECASYFLISSDMTVAEIAQHCGYNDSSFFIKQFKKYKGTTPKQYRMHPSAGENDAIVATPQ